MSTFVLIATHTSDQCPMNHSTVRQLLTADPMATATAMQKHGVKPVAGPYGSVSHRAFTLLEAPTVEAVDDAVTLGGLAQWNSAEIIPVRNQDEAFQHVGSTHPLY